MSNLFATSCNLCVHCRTNNIVASVSRGAIQTAASFSSPATMKRRTSGISYTPRSLSVDVRCIPVSVEIYAIMALSPGARAVTIFRRIRRHRRLVSRQIHCHHQSRSACTPSLVMRSSSSSSSNSSNSRAVRNTLRPVHWHQDSRARLDSDRYVWRGVTRVFGLKGSH